MNVAPALLLGGTVTRHALAVARELQGEVLLPLGLHILADGLGGLQTASGLGAAVGVDLLGQGDQGGLGGLADLKSTRS